MKLSFLAVFVVAVASVEAKLASLHSPAKQHPENKSRGLVVGGTDTDEGRYPYMVCISTPNGRCECGGSLIAPNKVLTAAHCSSWFTGVEFDIRIGEWNQDEAIESPPVELFTPGEYLEIPHPAYVPGTFLGVPAGGCDIMVIHLKREVIAFRPVKLDLEGEITSEIVNGDSLQLMGFGNMNGTFPPPRPADEYPAILQEVTLQYIPNDKCADIWSSTVPLNSSITEDNMCVAAPNKAGGEALPKSGSFGDSGGPVAVKGDTPDDDVQVGVVSFGYLPSYSAPGVLVRVAAHYDFLTAFLQESDCDSSTTTSSKSAKSLFFVLAVVFSLLFWLY